MWHRPMRHMAELALPKPDDGVAAYGPLLVYALALVLPIVVLLRRRSRGRRDSTPPDEESLLVAALRAEVAALRASAASPAPSTAKEDEAALRTEAAARREAEAAVLAARAAEQFRRRRADQDLRAVLLAWVRRGGGPAACSSGVREGAVGRGVRAPSQGVWRHGGTVYVIQIQCLPARY